MTFSRTKQEKLQNAWRLTTNAIVLLVICGGVAVGQDAKQAMFERVFGDAAKLDPAMVAKVKALPPGKRLFVDRDGDGKNDEAWYIDTAKRHTKQPILVRAIDEDGDLDQCKGPDRDSDLYIADWNADGTVDKVIDYQDNDGDGDVDETFCYIWSAKDRFLHKGTLRVWWACDDSDDNLLWYDVNWTHNQGLCQYRCHFSGDETFVSFGLTEGSDQWVSYWENPFIFYDPDGDGCCEIVARFEGLRDIVGSLRYSFDADGDAYGRRAYDYDFSITAIAEGSQWPSPDKKTHTSDLKLTDEITSSMRIRGIPTDRVLRGDAAQKFAQESPWANACLTWDEMNANTDQNVKRDPHERWEGILNQGSKNFPQIGGPPCSKLNKRNEVMRPASPLRLYYDPTDHRLHLLGAGPAEGWINVDYDLDGKQDAKYTYIDDNGDGIFDRRQIDLDADGKAEFDWKMKGKDDTQIKLEYESLSAFYKQELADVLDQSQQFIDAAKAALGDRLERPDPVETFFLTKLESWYTLEKLGPRMRSTPAGARYYMDLLRDRLLHALKQQFGGHQAWDRGEAAYAAGNYAAAAGLVTKELAPDKQIASAAKFQSFTHRLPISIDNAGGPQRDHCPIVLSVKNILAVAGDFNLDNCAVVAPDRWIDWLEIPHHVDQIDASVGRELSFLADLPAETTATYYLYYSPTGKRDKSFARKTGICNSWNPPADVNIGWESAITAYRSYLGHFNFFGKHTYDHSRKIEWLIYPITKSYHTEQEWGIDALHVGNTSGLGGLTLYEGDDSWIVRNPGGYKGNIKFTKRMLTSGPIRAAVEIKATNITADRPDLSVRFLCIIYAEHPESEIRVSVDGAGQSMLIAPGLTKLTRRQSFVDKPLGCIGDWGWQEDVIGEVGIGLIVPPEKLKEVIELKGENRLLCDASDGVLRYWIIGDWRRGRRFPIAPTIDNWRKELQSLAARVHREVRVAMQSPEKLQ